MTDSKKLKSATEMVKANDAHVLNESKAYRQARDALLAEEIELRRHIVRVAEQRRALPPGGEVKHPNNRGQTTNIFSNTSIYGPPRQKMPEKRRQHSGLRHGMM